MLWCDEWKLAALDNAAQRLGILISEERRRTQFTDNFFTGIMSFSVRVGDIENHTCSSRRQCVVMEKNSIKPFPQFKYVMRYVLSVSNVKV